MESLSVSLVRRPIQIRSRAGRPPASAGTGLLSHPLLRFVADTLTGLPRSVIAGSVAINLISLILPIATLQVYDRMIPMRAEETLLLMLSGVVVVATVEMVLRIARTNLVTWSATRLAWQVHSEAVGRMLAAETDWLRKEPAGRILERLQSLNSVCEWHASPSRLVLMDLPFVPLYLTVLAIVGQWLVLVPIGLFALLGVVGAARGAQLRQVVEGRAAEDIKIRDFLIETITGIATIKAYAMEPQMLRRFERLQDTAANGTAETIRITDEAQGFATFASTLTQMAMVSIGAVFAIEGSLSIGTLACCTMLAGWSLQPLLRAVALLSELELQAVAKDKARPLVDLPEGRPSMEPVPTTWRPASLLVEDLVIRRPVPGIAPVEIPRFEIAPGEIIAISGADGSGKSSLMEALVGIVGAERGRILLDGVAITTDPQRWAARVALVGQRNITVRGSVLENITLFRPDALSSAIEAARLIGLEAQVDRLAMGYDTRLGDGITEQLSDGLVQRLAIARAIARRPGLLILDEVNTSLDMAADRALGEGLKRLKPRATIIIVTNRPSMAAIADRAYQMTGGHLELVAAAERTEARA